MHSTMDFKSNLPDPEHHPFFTDPEPTPEEHWLVRLWEWAVSKWLPKSK